MFNTMTITKAFGSVCAAMLVFLLGGWAADSLYGIDSHGDDHVRGYVIIEEGAEEMASAEPEAEVPFEEVYASADAGAGERLWRQCSACHALEPGVNGVGPYLHGVVGRDKAAVDGFSYSDALAGLDGDWTPENISGFIENPRSYAPGTAMAYNGMRDIEDRANLVAYLATFN